MSDAGTGELVYWWSPRGDERVFDLAAWPEEATQLVRSMLEASEVPHRFEGGELIVASDQREETQELLDEVVAASRPTLEEDEDRVEYELSDWPPGEVAVLESALEEAGVVREWTEEGDLLVYAVDEERVDSLFDELGLRGPDDGTVALDGEELTELLNSLYLGADKLSRDPADPDAVIGFAAAAERVGDIAVPIGFDDDDWKRLQEDAVGLRGVLADADATDDDEAVSERARAVREHLRPWL